MRGISFASAPFAAHSIHLDSRGPRPMIAVYARVSSKQQDQRAQTHELRAWAKGQEEPAEFYSERESGTSMDRPEWQRLWADLLAGKITKLVCWRIDRLGRTARGLLELRDGDPSARAWTLKPRAVASCGGLCRHLRSTRPKSAPNANGLALPG
jgi:hypothetical protein